MKAKTLQIVWHGKEPVYSLDFHPSGILATGGADKDIKLWQVHQLEDGSPAATHMSSLSGHAKTVNCVRFSPNGSVLASAGDGGELLLWRPAASGAAAFGAEPGSSEPGWRATTSLRGGHSDDVFDLAWAPDASALLSGSIENICILWDVDAGKSRLRLDNHSHFVQGVAWDPARQFLVSQSADRSCRVYGLKPPAAGKRARPGAAPCIATARNFVCQTVLKKRGVPPGAARATSAPQDAAAPDPDTNPISEFGARAGSAEHGKPAPLLQLFHDEGLNSFFRRLAWSPEGSLLAVPAGLFQARAGGPVQNAAYLYARGQWAAPWLALPAHKPVVAARFCPVLFAAEPPAAQDAPGAAAPASTAPAAPASSAPTAPGRCLSYRMVLAVATMDSIVLYDAAAGGAPLALLGALHPEPITDLAWSRDGRFLAASSYDGYCSVAAFEPGELGRPLAPEELPAHVAALLPPDAQPAPAPSARSPAKAASPAVAKAGLSRPPPMRAPPIPCHPGCDSSNQRPGYEAA
ncbi:hypothetical protein WJX81_006208 [Elliptochloris bilobata]|uniref:CAF1B/HIR1 beta-propeller domain-containing protein n=1 Tax=Elliptochloris bilobata TaxID=381761 RepID=A0AAW1SCH8_9CHLO